MSLNGLIVNLIFAETLGLLILWKIMIRAYWGFRFSRIQGLGISVNVGYNRACNHALRYGMILGRYRMILNGVLRLGLIGNGY